MFELVPRKATAGAKAKARAKRPKACPDISQRCVHGFNIGWGPARSLCSERYPLNTLVFFTHVVDGIATPVKRLKAARNSALMVLLLLRISMYFGYGEVANIAETPYTAGMSCN